MGGSEPGRQGDRRRAGGEAQHAVHPRIVVDPAVLNRFRDDVLLRAEHHDLRDESEYIRSLLAHDADGLWFVDYLRAMRSECDGLDDYAAFLDAHRDVVATRLKRNGEFPNRVTAKFLWVATYHNNVCDELHREFESANNRQELLEEFGEGFGDVIGALRVAGTPSLVVEI